MTDKWERLRYGGLGLLLGMLVGAVGAGFVYVDARVKLAALDTRRDAQLVEAQESGATVRRELAEARAFEALLRARVAAGQALDELDRANFGLSREQLRYVGVALADVDPALVPVDPAALTEARRLVDALLSEVSPDAATQRDRLREVVRAVDGLIPRAPLG